MFLNSENSVYEEVEQEAPTELIPGLRGLLGAFLFRGDDIYKKTHVLSGGEKSRLSLIKLLLHPVNFLILDEPTNHLDIHSKDILLESLQQFSGTLIFVSHDRYFIEHLADRVIELEDGRAALYPGDYSYYLRKKETEPARPEEQNGSELREEVRDDLNPNKIKHSVDKRQRNKLQNLQKREGELLSEIEQLEQEIHKLHRSLEDPAVYSDRGKAGEKQKAIEEKHRLQEKLSREWEEIDTALASFQGGKQS
jgi:ATP-binding cassette subfamily F protein 3